MNAKKNLGLRLNLCVNNSCMRPIVTESTGVADSSVLGGKIVKKERKRK